MKKQIKSIIAVILSLLMLVSVVIPAYAGAANPTLTIDSAQAVKGSSVSTKLSISNNPGFAAATFKIVYDSSILKLESVTFNNEFGGDFDELGSLALPVSGSDALKAVQISWSSMTNISANGTFLTMHFTVNANAPKDASATVRIISNKGDFCDIDENDVVFSSVDGVIKVVEGIPGDINGDKEVNAKDLIRLRKYFTGWDVNVDILACDCNGDGNVNSKDLIRLRKYFSGWDVELFYGSSSTAVCNHNLVKTNAKAETCTEDGNIEYWTCSNCKKIYADANALSEITSKSTILKAKGHTIVIDAAVDPTYETTGLTEGSHCSTCKAVLKKQEVIPKLQKSEYAITYHITNNDNYLQSLNINNPNPSIYTSQDGLELLDLIVDGYEFKGWYTAQTGGTRVTEISKGSTGNKTLYAQWNKVEYVIDFDSPDAPVSSLTYTVDRGTTLTNPSWFGYTFVGWSKDGNIVSSIKPGTTGNIVLHANWTSNRNKARAVDKLENPNIIEDADNGRYVFVYEIGTIENVPLSQDSGEQINSEGITITKELSMSKAVQEGTADKIAKTVAKATTETSSWTLSENWNKSTSATNEHDEQVGKTQQRTDSEGNVVSGKYYVSNSKGGSTSVSSSVGGSSSNSSKVTAGASIGINGEYSHKENDGTSVTTTTSKTKEKDFNWNLGGQYGQSSSANLGFDLGKGLSAGIEKGSNWSINGGIGGSTKNSTTNTKSKTASHDEENAFKISNSRNFNVGTENSSSSEGHWDTSSSSSSNWNSTTGYESSEQTSKSTTVSNAISEVINDRYSYTSTDSRGGNNSSTRSTADTSSSSNEYASTVEYSTENTESEKKTLQFKSSATGYYRVITAGTVHVFGVVGYDIATNSYFTYTYNVLDSERHAYLDYSKENSRFTDCENGIIPFEIPYEVNDYISVKIGRSEGLVINEQTGVVKGYNGNADYVVIPEYISASDGLNKAKAVKVTGISENAFRGNTNIKGVLVPKHIRKIPANSFEGCTSLQTLIAMGINNIGSEAFKNCTSLQTFVVDEYVISLGKNAFVNAPEVYINAANESVAKSAFDSGAKKILVYLSNMAGSLDNYQISIPDSTEFFALMSDGREYKNLSIDSSADSTFLSNFKLTENSDTPLKLNSKTITLSRIKVEQSPGFSLISTKDDVNLRLYGNTELTSKGESSVLTKNVNLSLVNNDIDGLIDVTGNWLISGDISNPQKLSVNYTNGKLIHITNDEFNSYLTSSKLSFDSNGGNAVSDIKTIYYGQKYGELPTPTRENYTFEGWFTDKESGTEITANTVVNALVNQTLYAHWTPNQYVVSFDVNGENATVDVNKKTLTYGDALGSLPTPTRDYYTFDGWFTDKESGNKVSEKTTFDAAKDVVLYAHWIKNPTSNWVLESALPAGASVVDQKWTYDETTKITSDKSEVEGYTLYDTTSEWGEYGEWSAWSFNAVSASESRQVEKKSVHTGYYMDTYNTMSTGGARQFRSFSIDGKFSSYGCSSSYGEYHKSTTMTLSEANSVPKVAEGAYASNCSFPGYNKGNGTGYILTWQDGGTYVFFISGNVYNPNYRYRDRKLVYTYWLSKTEAKESTSEVEVSESISNIQKWVKYIEK